MLRAFMPLLGSLELRIVPAYVVSIAQFGAVGDGHTDSTAAIQKALASVPSGGGMVVVPPGVYEISQSIVITTSNTSLVGRGAADSEIQLARGAEVNAIVVGDATHRPNNVSITLLHVDGHHNGFSQFCAGVFFASGVNAALVHSRVTGFPYIGVWTGGGGNSTNVNVLYDTVTDCGSQDVSFGSVTNAAVTGCVLGAPSQAWGHGGPWNYQWCMDLEPDPHCSVNHVVVSGNSLFAPNDYPPYGRPLEGVVNVNPHWGPVIQCYGVNNIVNGHYIRYSRLN
jgi:hypothetical protein